MAVSMEGSRMKHDTDFTNAFPAHAALPDAPLAMPKQVLERRTSWIASLRSLLFAAVARS